MEGLRKAGRPQFKLFRESWKHALIYSSINDGPNDIAKPLVLVGRRVGLFGVNVQIVPEAIKDRQADFTEL
jgi:hypothetical protein